MENSFWAYQTAVVEEGAVVGKGTKVWHNSQVAKGAQVGEECVIGHNCFVAGQAKLGKGVKLESNIDVWDLVTLEDYVFVGPSAVFTNDLNPRARFPKKEYPAYGKWIPTLVREGATIGANATILCGITIGRWAMVGAGTVLVNDVPDYGVAVGNPGKHIGWVCECGNSLSFENKGATCGICKKTYAKDNTTVTRL